MRARLSPNASLPGSLVYTPIEAWSNDEVWMFLMQVQNPWAFSNRDLLTLYQGASADGECPLVVDTSTPSCGDSRFGCWVCTLVDKDKSMSAMIQNDQDKEWLQPLLDLRNALDFRGSDGGGSDRHLRDFRRMNGDVQLLYGRPLPGPYLQSAREDWLRRLLEAQTWVRRNGPEGIREGFTLVTVAELQEIRRIWVLEKHELEDSLPRIYAKATGQEYPGVPLDAAGGLVQDYMEVLAELCGADRLHYELIRELLSVERRQRHRARRAGLFDGLERAFRRHFYDSVEDAVEMARRHAGAKATVGSASRLRSRAGASARSPESGHAMTEGS
jgi:DNA sulfur modification protein DndC